MKLLISHTCGEGGRGGAPGSLSVSSPCFGCSGSTVVSPTLLHAPLPLRLPLSIDEYLRGAQLIQEFLLHILRVNPRLFFLPAQENATLDFSAEVRYFCNHGWRFFYTFLP